MTGIGNLGGGSSELDFLGCLTGRETEDSRDELCGNADGIVTTVLSEWACSRKLRRWLFDLEDSDRLGGSEIIEERNGATASAFFAGIHSQDNTRRSEKIKTGRGPAEQPPFNISVKAIDNRS